ncbi:phosphoenolpyruvate synthase [Paenactinomyces guangxiensis]|uniref:Phosphoenolpyruvate synthase n=1 Tax=Paenactinomyces guangxiensis TaxID=1490290 RepID=A0A7W2A9S6_9BACL|nr:phosphoenolpyruvate synthase [Paenactinomyces guangxiensis]MBA4495198.1 phosphoenolpyruvate synthase [Paenactinomyces guangxiensis]MBH8592282.1 phosphoenolpyruvate synthase [Paenactinomyces guangxiensis]
MGSYVLTFPEIDKTSLPSVGGKGANLSELTRAGFPVPQGFCVTTAAYRKFVETSSKIGEFFERLDRLNPDQLEQIREAGKQIRDHLESLPMPSDIRSAILRAWAETGTDSAYAVRSSATAEDLPTASFAGQQETYLNVKGEEQLLQAVQKCWASLFTDRAITYRMKNGFSHRKVFLSVVVQQMVFPEVSGIMFTADPVTGHRETVSIDAGFGLGEALVSGIVSADLYQVIAGNITKKQIADKKKAIYALPEGGTQTCELSPEKQTVQALPDEKILELAALAKKIEDYYGCEQDIEWCLAEGKCFILQSRPITSLYPVPKTADDQKLHVFLSFGHQQMMTEALRPLAISIMRTILPFGKKEPTAETGIAAEAGGRLYIDLTPLLYTKPGRKIIPHLLGNMDELMSNAISQVIERGRLQKEARPGKELRRNVLRILPPVLIKVIGNLLFRDTSKAIQICDTVMERMVAESKKELAHVSGVQRIIRIQENAGSQMLKLFSHFVPYLITGIVTTKMIRHLSIRWLGDDREIPLLNRSLPGNVTSEMGLALGDLADIAGKYPEVTAYLPRAEDQTFYEGLREVANGEVFASAFKQFIDKYGMRCPGEIDITKPRWRESPTMLVPAILSHLQTGQPGEHRLKFQQGFSEAQQAGETLLRRLRNTRNGRLKARWMSHLIRVYRDVTGIREHHKFTLIRHLDLYKQAILDEARQLVKQGILRHETDVFYLGLNEIAAIMENRFTGSVPELIEQRKKDYEWHQKLTPPRVITSEGEVITGVRRDIQAPAGSLPGTPVSAGIAEGYARVVLNPDKASLKPGDILIAPFTDPGWTPFFHPAKALVMEVGGLMTHGAVVAREYGIPAVVGVEDATKKIKDGQYIRVDGSQGFVQILDDKHTHA